MEKLPQELTDMMSDWALQEQQKTESKNLKYTKRNYPTWLYRGQKGGEKYQKNPLRQSQFQKFLTSS